MLSCGIACKLVNLQKLLHVTVKLLMCNVPRSALYGAVSISMYALNRKPYYTVFFCIELVVE